MALSSKQRSELKAKAHHLKPVVRLGQHGLTEAVVKEADQSLTAHELIKIHVHNGDRDERKVLATDLCQQTKAEYIGSIGKVFILYRANEKES